MTAYFLERNWSGYSRGTDKLTIEADSLEEALKKAEWEDGERDVVRDDTDCDDWEEA